MAASSRGAGVQIVLEPPIEFILKQAGRFRRELEDLGPLWELFKRTMEAIETEVFDTEGHGQWQALAEATLADRARLGFPDGPILNRTGDLRDSLVNPGRAADTGPMRMTWGTDVPYAHWHQDGGTTPGRPPQRKVLDIRVEDRRRLEADMVTWINSVSALTFGRI